MKKHAASTVDEYQKRINAVIQYVQANFDKKLSLEQLAGISNLSPYHFHRVFRAFLKEPLGLYINRLRMESAAKQLRYSTSSINEIAFSVGFDTPSSLTKSFNNFFGMSPSAYRKVNGMNVQRKVEIIPAPDIVLETVVAMVKPIKVIYIRVPGKYGNQEYREAWKKLRRFAEQHRLYASVTQNIGITHDDPEITDSDNIQYEACLSVDKDVAAHGDVGVKEIDGGQYAIFTLNNTFSKLDAAYTSIYKNWLPESGYTLRNKPTFDRYTYYTNEKKVESPRTEIHLPIQ